MNKHRGRATRACLAALLMLGASGPAHALDAHSQWAATTKAWTTGKPCASNDRTCNRCAYDVEDQMHESLYLGGASWSTQAWSFSRSIRYQPSNLFAAGAYSSSKIIPVDLDLGGFDVIYKPHVQGFAPTHDIFYAVTHSDEEDNPDFEVGSLSLVSMNNDLAFLYQTDDAHPSGLSVLGDYVVFGDGHNNLRLIDVERAGLSQDIDYAMPTDDADGLGLGSAYGGVAMTELNVSTDRPGQGAYLVIRGGDKKHDGGDNELFVVYGDIENPSAKMRVGRSYYDYDDATMDAQNVQLITECGTGALYTVHSGGDDTSCFNPLGGSCNGWFRLSKLEWTADGPQLYTVGAWSIGNDFQECWSRGGASVHVGFDGRIDYYCSARGWSIDPLLPYINYAVGEGSGGCGCRGAASSSCRRQPRS